MAHNLLSGGLFIWPVLITGCLILVVSISKLYSLYIKHDINTKKQQNGLITLIYLAGWSLLLGVCSYFLQLYSAGNLGILPGGSFITIICTTTDSMAAVNHIINTFMKTSSVAMLSLFFTFIAALVWFICHNRIHKIELKETH